MAKLTIGALDEFKGMEVGPVLSSATAVPETLDGSRDLMDTFRLAVVAVLGLLHWR